MGNSAEPQAQLTDLLHARYGSSVPQVAAQLNATLSTQLSHKSVRAFVPDALADGTLELLVAAAQSAPSSSNLQVWSVIAVQDRARKQRLATLANDQAHIRDAPLLLVFLADLSRTRLLGERHGAVVAGLDYLDTWLMGIIDATLAAQNVVTAAESLGLGTVYIGALRNKPEQVAAELGLPEEVFPAFGLVIGHPDANKPASVKPRLGQGAVLHYEQYQASGQAEVIKQYDITMQAFYQAQGLPQQAWSSHSLARLAGPQTLGGRDQLVAAANRLGFALK